MAWYGPDGRRLYYEDSGGAGDVVVLLPGWAGNIAEFAGLRRALAGGLRVIAADLPGSGRSEPQPRYYAATYYRDDAEYLLGFLGALGVPAAHLVGFSDGGEEALLMAALRPRCALSVVTWGAAGQIVAAEEELDALADVVDHPSEELLPLAAYLAQAYGADTARIMTGTWAAAMRGIAGAGAAHHRNLRRALPARSGPRDGRRDSARALRRSRRRGSRRSPVGQPVASRRRAELAQRALKP
jgi:pimeloyl-ACP methyl ester carboxylesterase